MPERCKGCSGKSSNSITMCWQMPDLPEHLPLSSSWRLDSLTAKAQKRCKHTLVLCEQLVLYFLFQHGHTSIRGLLELLQGLTSLTSASSVLDAHKLGGKVVSTLLLHSPEFLVPHCMRLVLGNPVSKHPAKPLVNLITCRHALSSPELEAETDCRIICCEAMKQCAN